MGITKAEAVGLVDIIIRYGDQRERVRDDSNISGLNNWKDGVALDWDGKDHY